MPTVPVAAPNAAPVGLSSQELKEALEVVARPLRDMGHAVRGLMYLVGEIRLIMDDHLWEHDGPEGVELLRETLGEVSAAELQDEVVSLEEEREEFRSWVRSKGVVGNAYSVSEANAGGRALDDSREIPQDEVGEEEEEEEDPEEDDGDPMEE